MIEAVAADASVVVGDVSLLDRGERDLVLSGWSGAGVRAPVGVAPQLLARGGGRPGRGGGHRWCAGVVVSRA